MEHRASNLVVDASDDVLLSFLLREAEQFTISFCFFWSDVLLDVVFVAGGATNGIALCGGYDALAKSGWQASVQGSRLS